MYPGDTASCMINETAVRVMGLQNPVGKIIRSGTDRTIVGVVSDFLTVSPNQGMRPVYIEGKKDGNVVNVRLQPGVTNVRRAQQLFEKYNTAFVTDLRFADAEHERKYRQARNASALINTFAGIAIFISCLGLFGLSVYMAENRTREIGIRKVLGATVASVTFLLTRQFIKLVVLAVIIATPLAWLFMNFFLKSFEYRTTLSIWIPAASAAIATIVALFTVSIQSVKAGTANPATSLRTE
jgi:putative ABC transport system permease protein